MDNLEIFYEMFPNIEKKYILQEYSKISNNSKGKDTKLINKLVIDRLLDITVKQESVKEIDNSEYKDYVTLDLTDVDLDDEEEIIMYKPCNIGIVKKEKSDSIYQKFCNILSKKKRKYERVYSDRVEDIV
tara:strand:+ start:593 stop:982 length:390 start_codon:yes stop_codon:yes gene_type:complete